MEQKVVSGNHTLIGRSDEKRRTHDKIERDIHNCDLIYYVVEKR